ncbi:hypothetical protein NPIL_42911 [Nephila pilipes]|uniref:Uncharacterized protein n=1 Tax=Nephila pilipes TaxID=299642 RepID=A0A8X6NPU7_NEPPI|nr:hypothetical protein NPIL_42911 [Nephila pilipes]
MPLRKDNFEERQEIDSNFRKFFRLKTEIAEDLKKTVYPNQCETHTDSTELEKIGRDLYYSENLPPPSQTLEPR